MTTPTANPHDTDPPSPAPYPPGIREYRSEELNKYVEPEFRAGYVGHASSSTTGLSHRHHTSPSTVLLSEAEFENVEQTSSLLADNGIKHYPPKFGRELKEDDSESARQTWWTRHFERPDWLILALHVVLCGVFFCVIYLALPRVRGTLFWVRLYVGLVCSIVGIGIGFTLLRLARKWIEAAVWATVIHQGAVASQHGIRLGDIAAYTSDGTSLLNTCKLIFNRWSYPGTNRHSRRDYDKRPWSLFLLFFLLCLVSTALLSFVLGRVAVINVAIRVDTKSYREVPIAGELSESDLSHARARWDWQDHGTSYPNSLLPSNDQPRVVIHDHNGSTVYFAEATPAQLQEGGHGLGTFQDSVVNSVLSTTSPYGISSSNLRKEVNLADGTTDMVLRYPKWGLRVQCETLPDLSSNLFTRLKLKDNTSADVVFVPRDLLITIYDKFGMQLPEATNHTDVVKYVINERITPGNMPNSFNGDMSRWIDVQMFSDLNSTIEVIWSGDVDGENGMGWATMDIFLVRLDRGSAPGYDFSYHKVLPVQDPFKKDFIASIDVGFEAVVCVELYEPWVVEVYNATSGGPSMMRVLRPGNETMDSDGVKEKLVGGKPQVNHTLSSVGKYDAFSAAGLNLWTYTMMGSENNVFQPTSALGYLTNSSTSEDYKGLDAAYFTHARGIAGAILTLPYLAGSGMLAARAYSNYLEASVHVELSAILGALGAILVLGIVAALCTPRLPRGVPRREFGLYSWLVVIHGDRFLHEFGDGVLQPGMDIEVVEKMVADERVKYTV